MTGLMREQIGCYVGSHVSARPQAARGWICDSRRRDASEDAH